MEEVALSRRNALPVPRLTHLFRLLALFCALSGAVFFDRANAQTSAPPNDPSLDTPALEPPKSAETASPANTTPPSSTAAAPTPTGEVQIIARQLELSVIRRSSSTKTYLFHLESGEFPTLGRIILLREGERPIMAFRVIKNYPEKNEIAARRVRRYRGFRVLDPGKTFLALEKTGEVLPPAPEETVDLAELEDRADLKDLQGDIGAPADGSAAVVSPTIATAPVAGTTKNGAVSDPIADPSLERYKLTKKTGEVGKAPLYGNAEGNGILEFDPELDASTSPPPTADATNDRAEHAQDEVKPLFEDAVEDGAATITVEEINPLDSHKSGVSLLIGLQRNLRYPTGSSYFSSGALRYAYTPLRSLLFHAPLLQDSLSIEGGIGFYKLINFVVSRDAYTVMPLMASARYNIHTSENLTFFLYAGINKGLVTSAALGSTAGNALLSSVLPALGGGLLFRVGPSWDFRADAGLDLLSAGMMLRF